MYLSPCFPAIALGGLLAACTAAHDDRGALSAAATAPTQQSIPWQEALALLRGGRVVMAAQTHDLVVTLTLADGTRRITREPTLDAIFLAITEHAPNAQDIVRVTE